MQDAEAGARRLMVSSAFRLLRPHAHEEADAGGAYFVGTGLRRLTDAPPVEPSVAGSARASVSS